MGEAGPGLKGRRLLVVGAGDHRDFAFYTWARAGLEVTVVDGSAHQRYERSVAAHLSWDVRDEAEAHHGLHALAGDADGITALADASLVVAARLAAGRGLPGPGVDAARRARNKSLLRRALQAAGLPGPAFAPVASESDIAAFCALRPGPFVLKPADNGGSAAVRVVQDVEEARRWWPVVLSFSPGGEGIIEEFIEGPEVSLEGVVDAGLAQVVAVTAKETVPGLLLERQHTVPAAIGSAQRHRLERELQSVVGAMGVQSCLVHAEFKLAGEGAPLLVEIATRPAGGLIPDLVHLALGVNLYARQAALACAQPVPAAEVSAGRFAAIRFVIGTGTVHRFVEPARLQARHPRILFSHQLSEAGITIEDLIGNWRRAGYVVALDDDVDALHATLRDAVSDFAELMGLREV